MRPFFSRSNFRLPIVDEKAPQDKDFDAALTAMRNTDADTACIFNCQMGKGRTTTGMILAVLLKDILFGDTSIKYYKNDKVTKEEFPDEDEYLEERAKRGQYEVLDNISKYIPGVDEGKAHIDHIIDLCGVPPAGKIIIFKPNWSKTLFCYFRYWPTKPKRMYCMDPNQTRF